MPDKKVRNYQIGWESTDVKGLEYLTLTINDTGIYARSVVIGGDSEEQKVWALSYTLECDTAWQVRRLEVQETTTDHHLTLISDGAGNWTDGTGRALSQLNGCIDVDIRATVLSHFRQRREIVGKSG